MKIEMARMGVFLVFLLAAAWQDFGTKQISSEILWLSGTAALVCQSLSVLCLAFIKEAGAEETVLWFFSECLGTLPGGSITRSSASGPFLAGLWNRCRRRLLFPGERAASWTAA